MLLRKKKKNRKNPYLIVGVPNPVSGGQTMNTEKETLSTEERRILQVPIEIGPIVKNLLDDFFYNENIHPDVLSSYLEAHLQVSEFFWFVFHILKREEQLGSQEIRDKLLKHAKIIDEREIEYWGSNIHYPTLVERIKRGLKEILLVE